jgi:threonine/homoserine/homoserine lactone efflux protein
MTFAAFFFAVLTLLLSPGPTNTLMGLAGAQNGLRSIAPLIPAELLGYLTTIVPLAWLGSEALERWPVFAIAMKLAAAGWVLFLAVSLWQKQADDGTSCEVTAKRVYLTTMLNPKALVFGLVLLPSPVDSDFATKLAIFSVTVMAVALIWGGAGSLTQAGSSGSRRLHLVQRIASGWLALVSITLIAGMIRA